MLIGVEQLEVNDVCGCHRVLFCAKVQKIDKCTKKVVFWVKIVAKILDIYSIFVVSLHRQTKEIRNKYH